MKNDKEELGRKLDQGAHPYPWKLYTQGHVGLLTTKHRFRLLHILNLPCPDIPSLNRSRSEGLCWDSLTEITMLGETTLQHPGLALSRAAVSIITVGR